MTDDKLSKIVAASTASEAGQLAAVRISTLRGAVLTNKAVTDAAWEQVFKPKTRVTSAKAAVKRVMSEAQMLRVVDLEERPEVIATMLEFSCPTPAVLDALAAKGLLTAGEPTAASTEGTRRTTASIVDTIARYWGAQLPLEWIESLPDPAPGRLRLWRLRRNEALTDDEVAAELATFEQWGSGYDQGILQWVLTARPQLARMVAGNGSPTVMTALAGSHLFGTLTEDEQAAALDLDQLTPGQGRKDWARLGETWFNTRAFAWMAAGGNPTTHRSVLERLIEPLGEQTSSPGAARNVTNRLKYRDWRVDSYETATDPSHLGALVHHVALGGKKDKGRPHSLPALIANPNLGEAEAATLARMLCQYPDRVSVEWAAPEIGVALTQLLDRFPELDSAYPIRDWHARVVEQYAPSGPVNYRLSAEALAAVRTDVDTRSLEWDTATLRWFEDQLADNADAWFAVYQLVDSFEGTVAELATVAGAVC